MTTRIMHGSVLSLDGVRNGGETKAVLRKPLYSKTRFYNEDIFFIQLTIIMNEALRRIFKEDIVSYSFAEFKSHTEGSFKIATSIQDEILTDILNDYGFELQGEIDKEARIDKRIIVKQKIVITES